MSSGTSSLCRCVVLEDAQALSLWPHPIYLVTFRDWGGPVSEQGSPEHFHSPQDLVVRGVGVETGGRACL